MAQTTSVVASYLELYEEGEVEHINGPTLCFPPNRLYKWFTQKKIGGDNPSTNKQ